MLAVISIRMRECFKPVINIKCRIQNEFFSVIALQCRAMQPAVKPGKRSPSALLRSEVATSPTCSALRQSSAKYGFYIFSNIFAKVG